MIIPERAVPALLKATRRNRAFATAEGGRAHLRALALRPTPYGPPRRLRPDVDVSVEHRHGWPVYSVVPTRGRTSRSVVYVHGGGWVNQISASHWQLVAQIAAEARATVVVPIYPLVPFGHAEDVVAQMVDLVRELGGTGGDVCMAGDSAGGQITLSTALELRDRHGVTLPRTVLISPALDLTWSNPEIPGVQPDDPWLGVPGGRVLSESWRGTLEVTDQRVSPLYGDLTGLGPITLFSGTHDILNPDAHRLRDAARAAGVDLDFHEAAGRVHVYPLLPTASGRDARRVVVARLAGEPPR